MIPDKTVGWEPAEPNACGHCGKTAPCECDNNRDGRNKKLGYLYPSSSHRLQKKSYKTLHAPFFYGIFPY